MGQLTARQELFAKNYALTGRKSRSAIAAGANPASARTRAYRWLKKAEIQERIEELRDVNFQDLRHEITKRLYGSVMAVLESGLNYREARRAIALMNRLGVYRYQNSVGREIEQLEEQYGVPFEEIVDIMCAAQFGLDIVEPVGSRAPQLTPEDASELLTLLAEDRAKHGPEHSG